MICMPIQTFRTYIYILLMILILSLHNQETKWYRMHGFQNLTSFRNFIVSHLKRARHSLHLQSPQALDRSCFHHE